MILRKEYWNQLTQWKADQIIAFNFEELEYEELCDYKKLFKYGGLPLSRSFVFYPAERFDIVGRQILKANK